MRIWWWTRSLPVAFTLALIAGVSGCGSDPEPGSDCTTADDCGTLSCFCPKDPVPGTCSKACSTDSDCASLGSGYTCRDFGTAATCGGALKICLAGG